MGVLIRSIALSLPVPLSGQVHPPCQAPTHVEPSIGIEDPGKQTGGRLSAYPQDIHRYDSRAARRGGGRKAADLYVQLLASTIQGRPEAFTDCVVPVFGCGVWLMGFRRVAVLPGVPVAAPAPTVPGRAPFRVARDGVAVQAGSNRAHNHCQQVKNACFQGQVRLIFSTRARAWRTRRARNAHSR